MSKEQIKSLLTLANSGDLANLIEKLEDYLSMSQTARVHDIVHQKSGDGLLHILARCGHTDCLNFLLTHTEVFVDQRNLEDKTALHEAAQYGQDTAVEILLQHGAQVNSLKRADWTPLMLAATKLNNLACVKILVTSCADLRLVNKDGWTSFHIAVRTGDLSLLEYLLQSEPGCWQTPSKNGRTPLHTACLAGHVLVVKMLLQLDITGVLDVNCPDSCGSTPLMDAARGNHLDCIVPLLERLELNLSVKDRYSFVISMNVSL
jgi:ankyrin repeat protein